MIFENPLGLLALSVIPIIILLQRFRQRPHRQNISSLFIWKQIEHYLTSKPLKNKRSLYLIVLLQILAVVFLSFALAKPIWKITKSQPPHFVFLIDDSASMGSIYLENNERSRKPITRWELLLNKIEKIIEETPTESIFSFYQAYQKEPLTNLSRLNALDIIKTLTLTEISSDVESLIPVIKDIDGQIYFCSDQLPSEKLLGYFRQKPHLILVGQPSNNKAIIRASASPIQNQENYYDIFASVSDYSPHETQISIELISLTKEGEKILGHQEATLKRSEDSGIFFRNIYLPEKHPLKIRLNIDDEMMCDNSVWLMPPQKDKINIALIGKNSPVLLKALRAIPYVLVEYFPTNDNSSKNDKYDIYIFNEILPLNLPHKAVVISGISNIVIENQKFWKYEGKLLHPVIQKIETSSPILNYCAQGIFTGIPWAVRVTPTEKEYLKPIIQGKGSSGEDIILLCEWQKGNRQLIIINFPIDWRTDTNPNDWTSTPSFPIFWTNLVNYLYPANQRNEDYLLYRTGQVINDAVFYTIGWHHSKNTDLFPYGIGINLCNEEESDNNGMSRSQIENVRLGHIPQISIIEEKEFDLTYWLVSLAGILLLLSWILRKSFV